MTYILNSGPVSISKQRPFLSLSDAAEVLGVSTKTVRRRIDAGELAAHRVGKRIIRVTTDALEQLISPYNPLNAATVEVSA